MRNDFKNQKLLKNYDQMNGVDDEGSGGIYFCPPRRIVEVVGERGARLDFDLTKNIPFELKNKYLLI